MSDLPEIGLAEMEDARPALGEAGGELRTEGSEERAEARMAGSSSVSSRSSSVSVLLFSSK